MEAHGRRLRRLTNDDNLVRQIKEDYRKADLDQQGMAMLRFAEKLTREPAKMSRQDVEGLKAAGFSDKEVLDIVHIASHFNYMNRIADALGVDRRD